MQREGALKTTEQPSGIFPKLQFHLMLSNFVTASSNKVLYHEVKYKIYMFKVKYRSPTIFSICIQDLRT